MFSARFWLQCIPLVFAVGCFDFLDKSEDDDDDDDLGDEGDADVYGPDGEVDGGGASGSTADAGAVEDDTGGPDDDLDADEMGDVLDMPGDECDDGLGVRDCDIECWVAAALNYLGDGICDVGDRGPNFDCAEFDADEGDCIEDTGVVSVDDADGGADDEEGPDSCSFGESICVEPNEPDNEAWCSSLGSWAVYYETACPEGFYGTCAIPVGGDYSAEATAHYYGDGLDGESACTALGGTYTAE